MLRINLLPAYIAERRKTRAAIAGFSALFAGVTAAMLAFFLYQSGQVALRETEANDQEILAQQVQGIQSDASRIRSEVQPILAKRDFVDGVLFYNTLRPRIFRNLAAYTYRNVEYNELALQGQTVSIKAFAREVSDVGRFLITMFGNPDLAAVSVSGLPGWPPSNSGNSGSIASSEGESPGEFAPPPPDAFGVGAPGLGSPGTPPRRRGYPFEVAAQLIRPVTPPTPPGSPAAAGGGPGSEFSAPPSDAPPPPSDGPGPGEDSGGGGGRPGGGDLGE